MCCLNVIGPIRNTSRFVKNSSMTSINNTLTIKRARGGKLVLERHCIYTEIKFNIMWTNYILKIVINLNYQETNRTCTLMIKISLW